MKQRVLEPSDNSRMSSDVICHIEDPSASTIQNSPRRRDNDFPELFETFLDGPEFTILVPLAALALSLLELALDIGNIDEAVPNLIVPLR